MPLKSINPSNNATSNEITVDLDPTHENLNKRGGINKKNKTQTESTVMSHENTEP